MIVALPNFFLTSNLGISIGGIFVAMITNFYPICPKILDEARSINSLNIVNIFT